MKDISVVFLCIYSFRCLQMCASRSFHAILVSNFFSPEIELLTMPPFFAQHSHLDFALLYAN
jgi:hypothetical protein